MTKRDKRSSTPAPKQQLNQNGIQAHGPSVEKYEAHSGPLPDPRTLEHYNQIVPGAAERILIMAEKHADHYCQMEKDFLAAQKKLADQDYKQKARGQLYAFLTSLIMTAFSAYALWSGHPKVAGAVGTTTIVALVMAFITGREGKEQGGSEGTRK